MLYRISCDHSRRQLDWIVNLQRRIITALCQRNSGSETVTREWIASLVDEIDPSWLARLLTKKDSIRGSERNLFEDIRLIAGLDEVTKSLILEAFENDQRLTEAYSDNSEVPLMRLRGIEGLDPLAAQVVRSFFEIFYNPAFYRQFGYKIPMRDGTIMQYDRDTLIQEFKESNHLYVCPFCDGDIGNAQVDHFLPKAKFPYLSCNPLNLIPICSNCNSKANKGEKTPLDPGTLTPTANWLHPYLRPAAQAYEIRLVRPPNNTLTASLYHNDRLQQQRLDNFSDLVQLQKTWTSALARRVRAAQRKIDGHRRRVGVQSLEMVELQTKLTEWAESEEDEKGVISFSIIGSTYLRNAASQDPLTWDELWVYNTTTV